MPAVATPPARRLVDFRVLVQAADGSHNYSKIVRAETMDEARAIVADSGESVLEFLPAEAPKTKRPVFKAAQRPLESVRVSDLTADELRMVIARSVRDGIWQYIASTFWLAAALVAAWFILLGVLEIYDTAST